MQHTIFDRLDIVDSQTAYSISAGRGNRGGVDSHLSLSLFLSLCIILCQGAPRSRTPQKETTFHGHTESSHMRSSPYSDYQSAHIKVSTDTPQPHERHDVFAVRTGECLQDRCLLCSTKCALSIKSTENTNPQITL